MCGSVHLRRCSVDTQLHECVRERPLGVDVVGQYIRLSRKSEERYPVLDESISLDGRIGTMRCYTPGQEILLLTSLFSLRHRAETDIAIREAMHRGSPGLSQI